MRLAALLAASLLAPSIASAVTDPTPGKEDSRIRSARYDPDQVIRLTSTGLSPVQVILEAGENQVTVAGTKVFTNPKKATSRIDISAIPGAARKASSRLPRASATARRWPRASSVTKTKSC